jgi:VPDSG-CTERM motif
MKRQLMVRAATTAVALIFLLTLGVTRASANTVTYQLTSDHCTGTCGPAGTVFGTITLVDVSSGVVQVTLQLNNGSQLIDTGGSGGLGAAFGFNLTGTPTIAVSNISNPNVTLESTTASTTGIHIDGFGLFEYGLQCLSCNGGSTPLGSTLSFTVSASGLSTASFNQLSTIPPGSQPAFFAVDILSGINGKTGPVDASQAPTVPDGGMTLMLLGGALLGLETLRRKFRV